MTEFEYMYGDRVELIFYGQDSIYGVICKYENDVLYFLSDNKKDEPILIKKCINNLKFVDRGCEPRQYETKKCKRGSFGCEVVHED